MQNKLTHPDKVHQVHKFTGLIFVLLGNKEAENGYFECFFEVNLTILYVEVCLGDLYAIFGFFCLVPDFGVVYLW